MFFLSLCGFIYECMKCECVYQSGDNAFFLVFSLNASYLVNPRKVCSGLPSLDIVLKSC
jgi:hypothetical protein